MLFLLIGFVTMDQQWIVCHVAEATHGSISIIHQAVLSKEILFSYFLHFALPAPAALSPPSLALCAGALYTT